MLVLGSIGRHRLCWVGNPLTHRPQLLKIFKELVRKDNSRAYLNQTGRLRLATCFFMSSTDGSLLTGGGQHKKGKSRPADCLSDLGKPPPSRIAVATKAERSAELVRTLPKCSSVDEVTAASDSSLPKDRGLYARNSPPPSRRRRK